ncbi:ABC transporter ATP-binding protein [bacterium (Candidatus Howlettbacteria) CG23_combo_of_CG06-09_8_20_14_all_37_9]|nr:MAG: ABC transporter ATP-binding protein [bacterium (Candidatus Howlettbacteria) CG23_combo_of_CG06-09_8_20_14_all_37_9]
MNDVAIQAKGLSKSFKIPHEKNSTLKQAALSIFSHKTYKEFNALEDISFGVKKGEFFGIIGRNGSGKSTLLKILAGIYVADKGKIEVNGKLSPFLELGVGFNPELTGRANIFLGGAILGLSKREIRERYDQIVEFSELQDFIDMKLKNYSSGMQVRLAFSLAINVYAEVLLMDEVLAVGDTNFQNKCLEEFHRFKEEGKTVVLVTHDISVVQRYCDRAMLLRNGKIAKIGNADDIGNEYIRQNIEDEENRLEKGQRKIETVNIDKNLKNAKIKKVVIFGKDSKVKNTFQAGENITVHIDFEARDEIPELNFGIGLYREEGGYVLGCNSQMDDYHIDAKKNYIEFVIENAPLLSGNYFINIVCFGRDEQNYFDFEPKVRLFKMNCINKKYRGIVDLEHKWRQ